MTEPKQTYNVSQTEVDERLKMAEKSPFATTLSDNASFNARVQRANAAKNPRVAFQAEINALKKYEKDLRARLGSITRELQDLEAKKPFDVPLDQAIEMGERYAYLVGVLSYFDNVWQQIAGAVTKMETIRDNLSTGSTYRMLKYNMQMVSMEIRTLSTTKPETVEQRDHINQRINELSIQRANILAEISANYPNEMALESEAWRQLENA